VGFPISSKYNLEEKEMFVPETWQDVIINFSIRVFWALVILLLGWLLARLFTRLVKSGMRKANVDESLAKFTGHLVYYAILVFAVVGALDRLGVATASIIAVVGAIGLAIGLALQGALGNFAAGVLIILFHPYRVGDLVEVSGEFGTVEDIQIFTTMLRSPENKTIIIPNGQATGGNIINYSTKGTLRVDMVFGIGYGDDIKKAKQILEEIVAADERVLEDPAPTIALSELGDSSVNFVVRPFVKVENYWGVYFDTTEKVKARFDAEGISIPFPQRDVHLFQEISNN
jgi:small conductance mechanosensitive channel